MSCPSLSLLKSCQEKYPEMLVVVMDCACDIEFSKCKFLVSKRMSALQLKIKLSSHLVRSEGHSLYLFVYNGIRKVTFDLTEQIGELHRKYGANGANFLRLYATAEDTY